MYYQQLVTVRSQQWRATKYTNASNEKTAPTTTLQNSTTPPNKAIGHATRLGWNSAHNIAYLLLMIAKELQQKGLRPMRPFAHLPAYHVIVIKQEYGKKNPQPTCSQGNTLQ